MGVWASNYVPDISKRKLKLNWQLRTWLTYWWATGGGSAISSWSRLAF